ncbi:DUF3426 domain-containing protein [Pseudomonas kuykendallii]|uniref:MJ0042 family finger-like domain-containing protein n=1 Tax=Pseudomonas kuykendallii TaxID=1007099 RepID=A0A1H2R7E9_9PSED|nr:DUF3426 domain-containing protein [Pseudomonas kuykendallii]MCQ4271595.1 DUF3426 domain-containing protein [Pseudomonas kuykendallii]SDW14599.1 MJ0042 family finger-like domain-containing protein [Pseudomonas kuykendallii]
MTDSFVTQCPHCSTRFRVKRSQLGIAQGAVRCGACMQVFNAAQQLQDAGETRPTAPPAPVSETSRPAVRPQLPPPGKNPGDTLWIHDDLDLDSLDLDEELAKLELQERLVSERFRTRAEPFEPSEGLSAIDPRESDEEAWAQKLLIDAAPEPEPEPPEPLPELPAPEPLTAIEHAPLHDPVPPPARSEPTLSLRLPEEPDDARDDEDEPDFRLSAERDDVPVTALLLVDPRRDDEDDEAQPNARHKPARSEPALRSTALLDLEDEPLQLEWQAPRRRWGRIFGWLLLNLLALAALAGQYLWYHYDELARRDEYRPWFEQLCPTLGCTLPSKVDIALIKSSNLVVRSHPEFTGALVVDAILYNRAPFSQPFPLLELRFADLNGQLLASRRFKPSEYLAGELAGQSEMPPQTPIHISLDILDPGAKAVNYSLSFHSPE